MIMIKKKFTKSDLRDGMVVEIDGVDHIVIFNFDSTAGLEGVFSSTTGWMFINDYTEDLLFLEDSDFDITKVYRANQYTIFNKDGFSLIWDKEEKPILTLDGVEYSESTLRSLIKKATE